MSSKGRHGCQTALPGRPRMPQFGSPVRLWSVSLIWSGDVPKCATLQDILARNLREGQYFITGGWMGGRVGGWVGGWRVGACWLRLLPLPTPSWGRPDAPAGICKQPDAQ